MIMSKNRDNNKDTELLFREINETHDIYRYVTENSTHLLHPSLPEYLEHLLTIKGVKKSQLIQRSGLSRPYAYEIFSGQKKPSRIKLLTLAFALQCTLDECQRLLTYGGHQPLYAKDMADAIYIHGLSKQLSIFDINDILYDLGMDVLE